MLNKLSINILWSMWSNFVSIPTDCPQRDERMGWTGDIDLFAPTATYLYYVQGFLSSWLKDVHIEQKTPVPSPSTCHMYPWLLDRSSGYRYLRGCSSCPTLGTLHGSRKKNQEGEPFPSLPSIQKDTHLIITPVGPGKIRDQGGHCLLVLNRLPGCVERPGLSLTVRFPPGRD